MAESQATTAAESWLTPGRFALLLGVFITALYPEVVLGQRTFIFRDFGLFGYPLASYHRECFWRGEVPLWNPFNNCGLPFLAQWNTLTLYPLSVIYLLLPLKLALGWFNLAHQFLGGLGMYFLAWHWSRNRLAAGVAGTAFAFNGFTLNCLIWPNYCASLAWMPWVVLAVSRAWQEGGRRLVLAALLGALQMLSGTPELILLTWLLLVVLAVGATLREPALWRRMLGRFGLMVGLVAGIAAAQLLPFLQLLLESQRDTGYDPGIWAMPLTGWANFLVPLFGSHATPAGVYFQNAQAVTSSYYAGIGVLALAVLAVWRGGHPNTRLLGGTVLVCLVLALGHEGRVYDWVCAIFPPLGLMRYPVKFLLLATFALPLLAALAVARFSPGSEPDGTARRSVGPAGAWGVAGLCAGLVALLIVKAALWSAPLEVWGATLASGLSRLPFLGGILWLAQAAPRRPGTRASLLLGLALIALTWLDLATHAPRQNPTVEPAALAPGLPPLQELRPKPALGGSRALLSLEAYTSLGRRMLSQPFAGYLCARLGLYDNSNLLDGIPKVDGFYALYLRHEEQVRLCLYPSATTHRANLADFLGVSQVSRETNILEFRPRPTFMPLVTAGQHPVFVPETNTVAAMLDPNWDPRAVVFLPPESRAAVTWTNAAKAIVTAREARAHRWRFEVEAGAPSVVVIAQAHYPAWQARVNDRVVPLLRANQAFQAVPVPQGHSRVELRYRDRWFQAGVLVSLLTLAVTAAAWFLPRLRGQR